MLPRRPAATTPRRLRRMLIVTSIGIAVTMTSFGCGARGENTSTGLLSPSLTATAAVPSPTIASTAAPTPAHRVACPTSAASRPAGGPVTEVDLCNASLEIPSWGTDNDWACPHGAVQLNDGKSARFTDVVSQIEIGAIVSVDVDHAGAAEAVVVINCYVGDPPLNQVVAFGRTANGTIHTLGQVVGPANGGNNAITGLAANADGSVRAQVTKVLGSEGPAVLAQIYQWRTYSWTGQKFVQTAGSTSFAADKSTTHLTLTTTPIVLAKPQGTVRPGSLTVTVKNIGTSTAAALSVRAILTEPITTRPDGPCTVSHGIVSCAVGDLAPGATWKFTLMVTVPLSNLDAVVEDARSVVQLLVGDQLYTSKDGLAVTPG
jgi:hypothetical protein